MSHVLITGAAGGIGKTFAAECASRGWNLLLTDSRADLLPPLAEGMRRLYGVQAACLPCDLTVPADRDLLWDQLARRGDRLSMLVNVAGTEFEGPFSERSLEELHALLRLNIEAAVEMTRRALDFRAADGLHIINISSLAAFYPMPYKAMYAASKRFLLDFSRALNTELSPQGVTVTAVCPAALPTNPRSIRGMQRQGFFGLLSMSDVGQVAYSSVEYALRGKSVYVPGLFSNLLRGLAALIPADGMARGIFLRWKVAHRNEKRIIDKND